MIDLDKFCKEVRVCSITGYVIGISSGEFSKLIASLRQAEKDAARYRWLKEVGRHQCDVDDFFDGSCDRIDEIVDEAMRCK